MKQVLLNQEEQSRWEYNWQEKIRKNCYKIECKLGTNAGYEESAKTWSPARAGAWIYGTLRRDGMWILTCVYACVYACKQLHLSFIVWTFCYSSWCLVITQNETSFRVFLGTTQRLMCGFWSSCRGLPGSAMCVLDLLEKKHKTRARHVHEKGRCHITLWTPHPNPPSLVVKNLSTNGIKILGNHHMAGGVVIGKGVHNATGDRAARLNPWPWHWMQHALVRT